MGALICVPPAAFFGFALGYYPSRMECATEKLGSGCYEGDLLFATLIFAIIFAPFFLGSLYFGLKYRRETRPLTNWWPLGVLCAVELTVVALCFSTAIANPHDFF